MKHISISNLVCLIKGCKVDILYNERLIIGKCKRCGKEYKLRGNDENYW